MLLRLAEGERVAEAKRRAVVLLLDRRELTITWSRYGARESGPGPHVHREHTDAFYVLEGETSIPPRAADGPQATRS